MGKNGTRFICKLLLVFLCACFGSWLGAGGPPAYAEPVNPTVVSPLSAMITHDTTPDVVLTAPAGTTITIKEGENTVGTATVTGSDPVTITLVPLSSGIHSLTAISGSNSSGTAMPPIIVDESEPFDIADIVVLTPMLQEWILDGSTTATADDLLKRNLRFLLTGIESRSVTPDGPVAPVAEVTVAPGTAAGTTKISSNSTSPGFYYQVSSSPLFVPRLGSAVPSGAVSYHPGDDITGVDASNNKYVGFYEADSSGKVLKFILILLTADTIKQNQDAVIGKVMDDSGAGIEGITLTFRASGDESGPVLHSTVTGNDGYYEAVITPGAYTVEAGGTGYINRFFTLSLVIGSSHSNDLILERQDAPLADVTAAPGINEGTTQLVFSSTAAGYYYEVSSEPLHMPKLGALVPAGAIAYTIGSDIAGVDKDHNKYIGFYETDDQHKVAKFAQITLTSDDIQKSTIIGKVTDTAGDAVYGVTMKFREGTDNRTGTVVEQTESDTDGFYEVQLTTGIYTVEVGGTGYVTSYLTRDLRAGHDIYNDLVVTEIPQGDDIRIVLTWGTEPRDLDSHFIGPTAEGDRFHIYYGNRTYSVGAAVYAQLDLDHTTGQGPETTTASTVLQQVYGDYTFYVHNYSGEAELSQSSAKVEVYRGSSTTPAYTYSVPTTGAAEKYWHVFDIEITEAAGTVIRDVNELTSTDPSSIDPPTTMLPPATSISSISAVGGNISKGEVEVNLGNNTIAGLSKNDFEVRAQIHNVTTGADFSPQITSFAYDPAARIIKIDPHYFTDGTGPQDQLEVTLTVGPSAGSKRLNGEPKQATFTRSPLPPLVRNFNQYAFLTSTAP